MILLQNQEVDTEMYGTRIKGNLIGRYKSESGDFGLVKLKEKDFHPYGWKYTGQAALESKYFLDKLPKKELKNSLFLWINLQTDLGENIHEFRPKKKGESVKQYNLLKKIHSLDIKFKENQYAKTCGLPLLDEVTERELYSSESDDEEIESCSEDWDEEV